MGHIYRNLPAVPVPPDAHISRSDDRVFYEFKCNGVRHKRTVGVMANYQKRTMVVNDGFRQYYPALWEHHFGQTVAPASQIHAGLYALALSVGINTGLYGLLQKNFGPQHGNAIMDFAMYSIRDRSNTAQLFADDMKHQMLFSRKALSDAWFSELFSNEMTLDKIHAFRQEWLQKCAERGAKKVWLCIDGSNNDCAAQGGSLAQYGHAKSQRQAPVVGYMWAVDAETGRPVTWFVYKGNTPDCKAIDEVIRFLGSSQLQVEGVILDRGFASKEVLDIIAAKDISSIVMLKSSTKGFVEMMQRHAFDIRWNVKQAIDDDGIFGMTDQVKVFETSKAPSCIALYFVAASGTSRLIKLMGKVRQAARAVTKMISEHHGDPAKIKVPSEVSKYLKLKFENNLVKQVQYDYEAWQKASDQLGYHAIASSEDLSAEQIHHLYQLRDVSEKQFAILKSQLDGGVTRSHSDAAIQSRLAVSFVASVIRTEILLTCKGLGFDINVMLRKLDDAHMTRMTGGNYEAVHTYPRDLERLLTKFGIRFEHFQKFALEINDHNARPSNDLERLIPNVELPRRGRKKGSKNKKTLEKEAQQAAQQAMDRANGKEPEQPQVKRRPGRPKGSKNKTTLEREALIAAGKLVVEEKPKGKPGRPKGSKNKRTLEREAAARRLAEGKRRPGRPRGSKNKPKVAPQAEPSLEGAD